MSLQTAGNALDVLPPDDLRVLAAVQPEEPARLAKEDPAGLLHLALRAFPDGEATGEALRKFLVPASISSAQWSAWWKRAREAAAGDARIDTRRAYDNLYRRTDGTEVEEETVPLPDWPEGADPVPLLPVFSTFLEHHPGRAAALMEAFVPRLREIVLAARTAPATRVACFLWLAARGEDVDLDLDSRVDLGFPMSTLSKAEQEQLLEKLDASSSLAAALGSRWVSIRRSAWKRLQERNETTAAARLVLERGRNLPEAGLHLLEAAGSDPSLTGETDLPPRLLACLLDLLERPPRETHRKRAMALLAPGSPLETAIRNAQWTETDIARLVTRLKEWQGSDRHRFPALEFLERAGLSQVAEDVEGHRARAAARLSRRVVEGDEEDPYAGFHLLTRPSFEKLQAERMRVGMELKTTIPQAIQRARELGDLRENAEYDAAKAKQASYAKRFEELDTLCRQSRFIEELDRTPDTVLPGTEVVLDPLGEGEALSLWILGEGDQELGKDVVSYKAPIGQALLQKRVGDEVRLPRDGEEFPARIRTVRERLP
jgi:transcription elongation factor GreA